MTHNAIASLRSASLLACAGLGLAAAPALAQNSPRAVTDETVTARDVAMTPIQDINIAKDEIPAILVRARAAPYASVLRECSYLRGEIADLDAVLGDDLDTAPPSQRKVSPGGIAQRVVGMLIPYRGVIREVSGASKHEWEFRQAISAGMMRRAYLKGLGEALDCEYPARPAPPDMAEALADVDQASVRGFQPKQPAAVALANSETAPTPD